MRFSSPPDDVKSHFLANINPETFSFQWKVITVGRDLPWCCTIANLFLCLLCNFLDLEERHFSLSPLAYSQHVFATIQSADWILPALHHKVRIFHIGQESSVALRSAPMWGNSVSSLGRVCVSKWWAMRGSWRVTGRQPAHPSVSVIWSPAGPEETGQRSREGVIGAWEGALARN